jgi:N-acetylmuramoyl-L-alanine amidase
MSFLSRVAAFAAVTFALAGLGQGAPGLAAELDRTAVAAAPAVPVIDAPTAGLTSALAVTPAPAPVLSPAIDTDTDVVVSPLGKFASLDAAVAAQDLAAADENLRCLASTIYFESKGEPISGQLAVAQVVINRARSGRFPPDICGVVTQRGQFSFVRGGTIPTIDAGRSGYRTALAIAKVALTEAWQGQAEGALFFHARRVAPAGRFVRVASIGNHIFYR